MAVIEFRHFLRRYTLADAEAGVTPQRQLIDGKWCLFAQPSLQWRARERAKGSDGNVTMEWTPWFDVLFVREGIDDAADAPVEPPKAA